MIRWHIRYRVSIHPFAIYLWGPTRVQEKAMKQLSVQMTELCFAFQDASGMAHHYLDLETGEVLTITDEIDRQLQDLYRQAHEQDPDAPVDLPALIEQEGLHDWQADMLLDADRVERGYGVRYIRVPQGDSREGYRDMEDFIDTVANPRLRDRLEQAIEGRGAFRRFKDALAGDDTERERWYAFQDRRLEQRVVEWLEEQGIEPMPPAGSA